MAAFVVSAALSCGIVLILFMIDTPQNTGKVSVASRPSTWVALGLLTLLLFFVLGNIRPVSLVAVSSVFSNVADYLGEVWVAQTILGLVTGALLAIWARQIYNAPSTQTSLTLAQRVEGIALIVLFVVGTTSTPIAELFREATVDTGVVSIKLSAATTAADETPQSNNWALTAYKPDEEGKVTPADEEQGIQNIAKLAVFMDRDATRILRYGSATAADVERTGEPKGTDSTVKSIAKSIQDSSKWYERDVAPLGNCIRALIQATGDEEYGRTLLNSLKPALAKLHNHSLTAASRAPNIRQANGRLPVGSQIAWYAGTISRKLRTARVMAHDFANSLDASTDSDAIMACTLPSQSARTEDWETVVDNRWPYLAIFYASVLQSDQQERPGIRVLNDWLEEDGKPSKEGSKPDSKNSPGRQWLILRATTARYLLYESLFRREPKQSQKFFDEHITRMRDLETLYQNLYPIEWLDSRVFPDAKLDVVETKFRTKPQFKATCPDDMRDDDFDLSWAFLNMRATLARRMTQSADFAKSFQAEVDGKVKRILKIDLGCAQAMIAKVDKLAVSSTRAEYVRVFMLYLLACLESEHTWQTSAETRRELRLAEAGLNFGLSLLAGNKEAERSELQIELTDLLEAVRQQLRRMPS